MKVASLNMLLPCHGDLVRGSGSFSACVEMIPEQYYFLFNVIMFLNSEGYNTVRKCIAVILEKTNKPRLTIML